MITARYWYCVDWLMLSSGNTMVVSTYAKQHIVTLRGQGMSNSDIASCLANEGILVKRKTVWAFLQHYKRTNTVCRMPRSGRPSKATDQAVLSLVEELMQNETTALQLHCHLENNDVSISLPTVLCSRQKLGWTFPGNALLPDDPWGQQEQMNGVGSGIPPWWL